MHSLLVTTLPALLLSSKFLPFLNLLKSSPNVPSNLSTSFSLVSFSFKLFFLIAVCNSFLWKANKTDLVSEVPKKSGETLALLWKCSFMEVSCRLRKNVEEATEKLFKKHIQAKVNDVISDWANFEDLPSARRGTSLRVKEKTSSKKNHNPFSTQRKKEVTKGNFSEENCISPIQESKEDEEENSLEDGEQGESSFGGDDSSIDTSLGSLGSLGSLPIPNTTNSKNSPNNTNISNGLNSSNSLPSEEILSQLSEVSGGKKKKKKLLKEFNVTNEQRELLNEHKKEFSNSSTLKFNGQKLTLLEDGCKHIVKFFEKHKLSKEKLVNRFFNFFNHLQFSHFNFLEKELSA